MTPNKATWQLIPAQRRQSHQSFLINNRSTFSEACCEALHTNSSMRSRELPHRQHSRGNKMYRLLYASLVQQGASLVHRCKLFFSRMLAMVIVLMGTEAAAAPACGGMGYPNDTLISGVIRTESGALVSRATIMVNAQAVAMTDEEGRFSFTMPHPDQPGNLFFSYDSMTTAVRSYYPSMGNTSYDVTLKKPKCCCNWRVLAKKRTARPAVQLAKNGTPIQQAQLNDIVNQLKEDPTASIVMIAHPRNSKTAQRQAVDRLDALKTQLVEQLGISADRIQTRVSTDKAKREGVEVEWVE